MPSLKEQRKNHNKNLLKSKQIQKEDTNKLINNCKVLTEQEKEFLIKSNLEKTKIVLVFALNQFDCAKLVQEIVVNYCIPIEKQKINPENDLFFSYNYSTVHFNSDKFPQLKSKEKYIFIPCPRDIDLFLDYCKIADILLTVTTTQHIDIPNLNLKPADSLNAIDDIGIKAINCMRSQGALNSLSCVVGMDLAVNPKKKKDIKFYFRRLLEEDFPNTKVKFMEKQDDLLKFLIDLINTNSSHFDWRANRGYFLVDKIEACSSTEKVYLSGFLKNSWALNENCHLTSIGDYQPKIIISQISNKDQMTQYFKNNENLDDFQIFNTNNTNIIKEDDNLEEEEFGNEIENELMDLNKDFLDMNVVNENNDEIIDDEDDSLLNENNTTMLNTTINNTKLVKRDAHNKCFEDEVEYEQNELVRERYRKYKYMKSFLQNDWNKYDNLPDYYRQLFTFKNIQKTYSVVKKAHFENSAFFDGTYITLVFENSELFSNLKNCDISKPLIVSSLFRHERKMSLMHCKVRFHNENETEVNTKKNYIIHSGFRKFTTNLMFSNIFHNCNKFKMVKNISPNYNNWYLASFYGQVYFPPNNILIFSKNDNQEMILENNNDNSSNLKMIGHSLFCDPFKVILKRIILTGYPVKTKKKTAVVKFMFFNPEDVVFYQKNEVYTKFGLKGKIKEKLGTHGAMKLLFNNVIKQTDIVCMNLYKRVYPKYFN